MNWVKIILYRRFSSMKQKTGTSLQRQLEEATAFCQSRGWTIGEVLTDEAKSAFHGHHRSGGVLGTFEAEAMEGLHKGTLLVVENLDRLSREKVKTSFNFICRLLEAGVTILTYDDGKFYDEDADMVDLIVMLTILHRGNGESETKSNRSKSNWAIKQKRAIAEGTALSKRCKAWLKVVNGRYELDQSRTPLLNRIFMWADAGEGSLAIVRKVNASEKPWGKAMCWHRTDIIRLLTDRAVIGEHVINGEVVKLYPAAVPADVFERVSASAEQRKCASRGNGRGKQSNLLSGLCRCDSCNGPMQMVGVGYLRCLKAMQGACENRTSVAYVGLEKAVLDQCLHLALDDNAFTNRAEVQRLNVSIAERSNDLSAAQDRARSLMGLFATQQSALAQTMALEAEQRSTELAANLKALKAQREQAKGRASGLEHMKRVADMRSKLGTDVTLRKRVAIAFQGLFTQCWFAADGTVTLAMAGGMAAMRVRDGQVLKCGHMAGAAAAQVVKLHFAGTRDAKAAPAVMKRLSSGSAA